jgi:hypothetical protein
MADFLQQFQGPGGVSFNVPSPIFTSEGYSPAIGQLARSYSQEAFNAVRGAMGQRGLLDSSGYPAALEGAFRHGFQRAVGDVRQERDMFSRWALAQMQLAQQVPPEAPSLSPLQRGLEGALSGALVGSPFGKGKGAGIGAVAGGLAGFANVLPGLFS